MFCLLCLILYAGANGASKDQDASNKTKKAKSPKAIGSDTEIASPELPPLPTVEDMGDIEVRLVGLGCALRLFRSNAFITAALFVWEALRIVGRKLCTAGAHCSTCLCARRNRVGPIHLSLLLVLRLLGVVYFCAAVTVHRCLSYAVLPSSVRTQQNHSDRQTDRKKRSAAICSRLYFT